MKTVDLPRINAALKALDELAANKPDNARQITQLELFELLGEENERSGTDQYKRPSGHTVPD